MIKHLVFLALCVASVAADSLQAEDKAKKPKDPYATAFKNNRTHNRYLAERMGGGMLAYFALVIFLRSLVNLCYKLSPSVLARFNYRWCRWLRARIFMPPTFSRSHSAPHYVGRFSFMIPTRDQTLILFGYFAFWVIAALVGYKLTPEGSPTTDKNVQRSRLLADRMATLSMFQLPLLIFFGGRNEMLGYITGWPLDTFNVFHKWIGRMFAASIITHAVCFTVSWGINGTYESTLKDSSEPYLRYGIAAVIFLSLMVFFAMHYFRQKHYELFLYGHIALCVGFMVGTWYHVKPHQYFQCTTAAVVAWGFDRAVRILRILLSGLNSKAHIRYHQYGNVLEITLDYSGLWSFYPGSFVYVHFLTPAKFWQAHPFTVLRATKSEEERGKLRLYVRAKHGITDYLKQRALNTVDEKENSFSCRALIEGPHGTKHHLSRYNLLVLFAGGIGITGVYCYVQDLLTRDTQQHIVLNWVVADQSPLTWFHHELTALARDPRFEVHIYARRTIESEDDEERNEQLMLHPEAESAIRSPEVNTPKEKSSPKGSEISSSALSQLNEYANFDIVFDRPNVVQLTQEFMAGATGMTAFVVCGPGALNDEVRTTVANNLLSTEARVDYFEESFSW